MLLFIWAAFSSLFFSEGAPDSLFAKKIDYNLQIDAALDEAIWQDNAYWVGNYHQLFPYDSSLAVAQTKIKIAYNDRYLYIAAVMLNKGSRTEYISTSLRRDFRGEQNDGVTFLFDTYHDNTTAFQFGVNPFGVQREALIANGGMSAADLNLAWDNKWHSAARINDDHWIVEIAIPFSTLRYKDGTQYWNFNSYRIDSYHNETSTLSHIPRNFVILSLAFMKKLYFEEPLRKSGSSVSLIPYIATGTSANFLDNSRSPVRLSVGGDAKIPVGSALNLDLTINPDFSQVEVDEQVTNLDRFEIFFPERRQFFLENADLFSDFGTDRIRPFFSRRIGVDIDPATGQNIQVPILFGARLSGKLNDNFRLGAMNMQTANQEGGNVPGKNFSVLAMQRKVWARSNIGLIGIHRATLAPFSDRVFDASERNSLLGADFNLATKDNRWTGKAFVHRSMEDDRSGMAAHANLSYNTAPLTVGMAVSVVEADYNPASGFLPRKDIGRFFTSAIYRFFPKSRLINRHGPGIETEWIGNGTLGITDELHRFTYMFQFQSQSVLSFYGQNRFTYLFFPFDPTRTGGERLEEGTSYRNTLYGVSYVGNARKKLNLLVRGERGQYFNGDITTLASTVSWRPGIRANVSMNFSYNNIGLPKPYNSAQLWLVGPRIDITLNRNFFWTTFVQYNSQIDNLNINTRVQWRFAPVSDFFVVYTDNYFPETLQPKQRAFIAKLSYWFNV